MAKKVVTLGEIMVRLSNPDFKRFVQYDNFDKAAALTEAALKAARAKGITTLHDGKDFYHSKQYKVRIIDRMGSGDSFASGFIYRLVSGMEMNNAAEFGVAASALKHII